MESVTKALEKANKSIYSNTIRETSEVFKDEAIQRAVDELVSSLIVNDENSEIKFLGSGNTSVAFEVSSNGKEYVLKVGPERVHFNLPEHKHILKPLLRRQILDKEGNVRLVIEIQDKIKTFNQNQYGVEGYIYPIEAWDAWKEMVADGIVAGDFEPQNLGRDKNGEVVLFDTDKIYTEEELGDGWDDFCYKAEYGADRERPAGIHYKTKKDITKEEIER